MCFIWASWVSRHLHQNDLHDLSVNAAPFRERILCNALQSARGCKTGAPLFAPPLWRPCRCCQEMFATNSVLIRTTRCIGEISLKNLTVPTRNKLRTVKCDGARRPTATASYRSNLVLCFNAKRAWLSLRMQVACVRVCVCTAYYHWKNSEINENVWTGID